MKSFPTHAVLSLMSGRMIPPPGRESNGFADMHELADHVAGASIFNYMLVSKPFTNALRARLLPHLPPAVVVAADSIGPDLDADGVEAMLSRAAAVSLAVPTVEIVDFPPLPDSVLRDAFETIAR